jgi:hypothetical protein
VKSTLLKNTQRPLSTGATILTGGLGFSEHVSMSASEAGGPVLPEQPHGMMLRDWFAGQVMAGMVVNAIYDDTLWADMAQAAYGAADVMLQARDDRTATNGGSLIEQNAYFRELLGEAENLLIMVDRAVGKMGLRGCGSDLSLPHEIRLLARAFSPGDGGSDGSGEFARLGEAMKEALSTHGDVLKDDSREAPLAKP